MNRKNGAIHSSFDDKILIKAFNRKWLWCAAQNVGWILRLRLVGSGLGLSVAGKSSRPINRNRWQWTGAKSVQQENPAFGWNDQVQRMNDAIDSVEPLQSRI